MNIQKKKLINILVKVQSFKDRYSSQELGKIKQFIHCLLLLYFVFVHTNASFQNSIFALCKRIHLHLEQYNYFVLALSTILFIINILILSSVVFMVVTQGKIKFQKILLHLSGSLSLIFDYLALIFLVAIVVNCRIGNLQQIENNMVNIITLLLSEIIIVYSQSGLLFSKYLIFILVSGQIASTSFILNLTFFIASAFELYYSNTYRICYLLILTINFLIFIAEVTQTDITNLQLISVSIVPIIIQILRSQNVLPSQDQQNDFLLQKLAKLRNLQPLSSKQTTHILLILQGYKNRYKDIIDQQSMKRLKLFLNTDLTIQTLHELLAIKIKNYSTISNALQVQIESLQCQLALRPLNMAAIYRLYQLKQQVEHKCQYSLTLRMQSLINQIQGSNIFQTPANLNALIVIYAQKRLERFYYCLGKVIQEIIALWESLSKSLIHQYILSSCLKKVVRLEDEALHILQSLQKDKDLSFQFEIFNLMHKITSADANEVKINKHNFTKKLKQTDFILVCNNTIKDASTIIADQLCPHDKINDKSVKQIFYHFYAQYIQEHMDELISFKGNNQEHLIPFRVCDNYSKLLVGRCSFTLLPQLDQGVKYIIKFAKQEPSKIYILYCLEQDNIQAFSNSFFLKYKIDQNQFAETILAQTLFHPGLYSLLSENSKVGAEFSCQLNFTSFRRRKSIKAVKRYNSSPVTLFIRQLYAVKDSHYFLLEITGKDEIYITSTKQSLGIFLESTKSHKNTFTTFGNKKFCRIRNPLEAVIDQKFSRANIPTRISYSKVVVCITISMVILILASLFYLKSQSQGLNDCLISSIREANIKNSFVQVFNQLFYQYYQYYQIVNYPNQFLKIDNYNMTALTKQYFKKVNENINFIMPQLLGPDDAGSYFTAYHPNYSEELPGNRIHLIGFLENAKQSLILNTPLFMVRNQHNITQIVDSPSPFDRGQIQSFSMVNYMIWVVVSHVVLCFIIKFICIRLALFKWKIFSIYSSITQEEIKITIYRLNELLKILIKGNFYKPKQQSVFIKKDESQVELRGIREQGRKVEQIGVIKDGYILKITSNNLAFLIPILTALFFMFNQTQAVNFTNQSLSVMQYSRQLQTFTVLVLKRATDYFQTGMEAILDKSQRKDWNKSSTLQVPTELGFDLPPFFNSYKVIQQKTLQYNLCEYSYLNKGSLYKNINCSVILNGVMNQSFTQAYYYLLQSVQKFGGVPIQQFGDYYRPGAFYPFYMEVCYARRTINNMLAYVQSQFTQTLDSYFAYQQAELQVFISIGFLLLPILAIILYFFHVQIKEECKYSIRCLKILPRAFLTKITISKSLKNSGVLDQIQLIAV